MIAIINRALASALAANVEQANTLGFNQRQIWTRNYCGSRDGLGRHYCNTSILSAGLADNVSANPGNNALIYMRNLIALLFCPSMCPSRRVSDE